MNNIYKFALTGVLAVLLVITAYSLITYDHQSKDHQSKEESGTGEEAPVAVQGLGGPEEATVDSEADRTPGQPNEENIYGSWVIDRSVDELTGEENVTAVLESENITKAWMDTTRPALIVRCLDDNTEILLNTRHRFEVEQGHKEEVKISYIKDDSQPVNEYWSRGPEGKSAIAAEPESLARQLLNVKVLRIEFTPFNADTTGAVFDMNGFENVIKEISSACEWDI